jgi:hypothetical protein
VAKRALITPATEHKIEEFADDLGRLLGTAQKKAEGWLGQREAIVKHLTGVRDTASKLLADLGHQAKSSYTVASNAYTRTRRGRPAGSKNKSAAGIIIVGGKTRRTMSAKARKAISMAQKARWAKQKAGEKKK